MADDDMDHGEIYLLLKVRYTFACIIDSLRHVNNGDTGTLMADLRILANPLQIFRWSFNVMAVSKKLKKKSIGCLGPGKYMCRKCILTKLYEGHTSTG